MSDRRQLAIVVDYADLIAALRARKSELNVSNDALAEATGLSESQISHCLIPPPTDMRRSKARSGWRMLGPKSFGEILYSLGLALVVVEDAKALRHASEMQARRACYVRKDVRMLPAGNIKLIESQITRSNAREMGRKGAAVANARRTPRMRKEIAKRAAQARWQRAQIGS